MRRFVIAQSICDVMPEEKMKKLGYSPKQMLDCNDGVPSFAGLKLVTEKEVMDEVREEFLRFLNQSEIDEFREIYGVRNFSDLTIEAVLDNVAFIYSRKTCIPSIAHWVEIEPECEAEPENEVEPENEAEPGDDLCGELKAAVKSVREERRILANKIDEMNLTDDEKIATFKFIMYGNDEDMKLWKEY